MKKAWFLVFLLGTVPCSAQKGKSSCPPEGTTGLWSSEAVHLCPQYKGRDFSREMRLQSPDHQTAVHVVKEEWWVEIEGRKLPLTPEESRVTENAELAWAPDGKAFYITQSENVAGVQGFHTEVYRINNGELEAVPGISEIVRREFDRHHECVFSDSRDGKQYVEGADIGAVKWVDGSNQILMVAEIPLDSNCERGYFAGYLVSLNSRQVVQRYTARQLMERWNKVLGDRLKEDFRDLNAKQRNAVP